MGNLVSLLTENHTSTQRDYKSRAGENKFINSEIAKKFGKDFWDGDRKFGYGGYKDDGRWKKIADQFLRQFDLAPNSSLLDIGCGKGFFLNAVKNLRPDIQVQGCEISEYAIIHAPETVKEFIGKGNAANLPYENKSFDLVLSINTLHNLLLPDLFSALANIERVSRKHSYICVESYRNEKEKWNLMRWQLTCECFFTPEEWVWIFNKAGYHGEYEFIFFE